MRFLTETDFPPSEKTKLRRCHNSPPSPDFLLPISQSSGSPGFFNLYYHNFFILASKKLKTCPKSHNMQTAARKKALSPAAVNRF